MAEALWNILDSVATGGILWLSLIFLIALAGELGFPLTSPILESLLIYTGFRIASGAFLLASAPFLLVAFIGRLGGGLLGYHLSNRLGMPFIKLFGHRLWLTPEKVSTARKRLSGVLTPTIIAARFTPGFSVLTTVAAGTSRVKRGLFAGAVVAQLLIWEAVFLSVGAIAGAAARPLDPGDYPRVVIVTIVSAVTLAAIVAYVFFQKIKGPGKDATTSQA